MVTLHRPCPAAYRGVFFLLVFGAAGCATYHPSERVPEDLYLPDAFSLYDEAAPVPDRWWEAFGSPELNHLVAQALTDNLSLQQVHARLRQAEMTAIQVRAARLPELTAGADHSVSLRHTDTGEQPDTLGVASGKLAAARTLLDAAAGGASTITEALQAARSGVQAIETLSADPPDTEYTDTLRSHGLGVSTSYEVDLWGRVRAGVEAAESDLGASREDLRAAMLGLTGAVAQQWLAIMALTEELALVRSQLALNQTTQELVEFRHGQGLATALDVFQQRQIVAQTESLVPPLASSLETARQELAVLLGRWPRSELPVGATGLPEPPPLPALGLPMDLLANRPDVRAYGLRLRAADWRVSAARSARLPSLRLTASASYGAGEWDLLFDNWVLALAGSLTGPIFDAGRRKAEVERTLAVVDERLAAYKERVLVAVKEVETALRQETRQVEYIDALHRELEVAALTHRQALERWKKGLSSYLPVLSALTQLQVLERRLLSAEYARLGIRVRLYLALGGDWMEAGNGGAREDAQTRDEDGRAVEQR